MSTSMYQHTAMLSLYDTGNNKFIFDKKLSQSEYVLYDHVAFYAAGEDVISRGDNFAIGCEFGKSGYNEPFFVITGGETVMVFSGSLLGKTAERTFVGLQVDDEYVLHCFYTDTSGKMIMLPDFMAFDGYVLPSGEVLKLDMFTDLLSVLLATVALGEIQKEPVGNLYKNNRFMCACGPMQYNILWANTFLLDINKLGYAVKPL